MGDEKSKAQRIAEGLMYLERRHKVCETSAAHEVLYAGPFSEDDRATMEALGWFEQEQYECWGFFT